MTFKCLMISKKPFTRNIHFQKDSDDSCLLLVNVSGDGNGAGNRVISVAVCNDSGSLPAPELVYTMVWNVES